VALIACSMAVPLAAAEWQSTLRFWTNPLIVMLLSLAVATYTLGLSRGLKIGPLMDDYGNSVKDIAVILLIIAGAGTLKEVFVATGVSMFPGSRAGRGSELRVRSTLHVNSRLEPGSTVPIGWIAAGDPAELFSPDRHDELWAAQEPLDFPGTVYGVPRGTSMREIMRRQSAVFGPSGQPE
jgi:hypothetical protein